MASVDSSTDLVVLFIPVAFCDLAPAVSPEELRGILFGASTGDDNYNDAISSASGTVAGYFDFCSNGRRSLSPENTLISEAVTIPCNGSNSYGAAWTTSRCSAMDLYGWAEAALDLAVGRLAAWSSQAPALDRIQHVVLITPDGSWWKPRYDPGPNSCTSYLASGEWGRLRRLPLSPATAGGAAAGGDSGDGSGNAFGFVWLTGERRFLMNTYLHELSHNLGLYHAGSGETCQYCDRSSAMGACCWARCHNAAHLWALGWADPLDGGALALEGMPEGVVLPYRLPAQHSSDASFIMIDASQGSPNGTRVFVSYRRLRPPYEVFDPQLDKTVLVHRFLSGGARIGSMDTVLAAKLQPPPPPGWASAGSSSSGSSISGSSNGSRGGSGGGGISNGNGVRGSGSGASTWRDEATRLLVQVLGSDGASAVVTICRAPLASPPAAAGAANAAEASGGGSSAGTAPTPPSSSGVSAVVDWNVCLQAQPDAALVLQATGVAQPQPPLPLPPPATPPPPPPPPLPLPPWPRPAAHAAVSSPEAYAAAVLRRGSAVPPSPRGATPTPLATPPKPAAPPGPLSSNALLSPAAPQAAGAAPRRGAGRNRGDSPCAPAPPVPAPAPAPAPTPAPALTSSPPPTTPPGRSRPAPADRVVVEASQQPKAQALAANANANATAGRQGRR
ncbi:hypothetical protein HYH02_008157 [Chlamydomonas schloesseri]|uniref:Peptidase M11 gametolysin domain-containing protein n=1 Tax=Chlamydomonas schloesseri TaxID=2026947 RepID=A0A835WGQ0_9CHLO|nr:hypothetical protein HYH02_008157 [Chlamydomonas schloesseri]|eukprot:KAG2447003.1 hypothetical protein HYH02_008157 [Chlamydomonas schloesseri]